VTLFIGPNIFEFTDYREYLRVYQEARKALQPQFSHRFIHAKVGTQSAGWFSDIVKRRINLTGNYLIKLLVLMDLKGKEREYFEALVHYDQAGSVDEKNHYYERLLSFKEVKADLVRSEKFEYYRKWYYAAVRELLFIHDFSGDYAALGKRLEPPITASEARKAIKLLLKLEFVAKDARGLLRPLEQVLKKDTEPKSLHLANFLTSNMGLAIQSLDRHAKEDRDVSALTLVMTRTQFEAAKIEIKALRKRLLAMGIQSRTDAKVYQCNFQIFPVSK
jgi:uncharacterized protein (TIGR02147 family)